MTKEEKWINYCVEFENFCSSKGTMKENKVIGWENYENHLCDNTQN